MSGLDYSRFSIWTRFWHEPIRAEGLALTRILLGICLVTDQLVQYLPYLDIFYGPEGVAPTGVHDEWLLSVWRWTILPFHTDNMLVINTLFWLRFAASICFLFGWKTRTMTVIVYLLSLAFINRNPALRNGGDDTLMVALFLLLFAPSGKALSLDRWLWLRKQDSEHAQQPAMIDPWPVGLLQIQLCIIYFTTGLAKLVRSEELFVGTWWEGSSVHYVLNYITMSRFSYAQLPLPFWFTATATYLAVWWEVLFIPLVMYKRTRLWTLLFGILFHLGIFLTLEVGWFGFYTMSLYGVWLPDSFWQWIRKRKTTES